MTAGLWIADGWGLIGTVAALALLTLLALAVLGFVRPGDPPSSGPGAGSGAVRLLEERYARGEISREEFLERREVLSRRRGDGP